MDYGFSGKTFPLNKKTPQHHADINEDDLLFECTLLAGHILGVECCDTVTTGDRELGVDVTYFQITPDPYKAKSVEEKKNYEAFNNYFYANYGIHKDRCYFYTEYEAFYSIVKAWKIWKYILSEDEKEEFFRY
ncbi:hypothetical protein [Niabella soli]|uniref:Uncharacterized protein n=1 Tax=Niabella soli DSM 19437 TaxID=929713 RepID=W0F7A4_9BACT|nr:hypothetical protein [Niabella soli]AHF17339.1 hypothetical protein NIASO_05870 [Niabella soli DSM 19437]